MTQGYCMSDPGYQVCRSVLLRAAEDWSDYLTGFETGPRAVTHRAALEMAVGIVRKFTCPLFTDESVAQEMFLLSQAVKTLDNLTLYGTWDDEDDDVFAARSEEERVEKAQQDVDWCVYRLLTGLSPCTDCANRWDFTAWKPSALNQIRCETHLAQYRAEREAFVDSRPSHMADTSSATKEQVERHRCCWYMGTEGVTVCHAPGHVEAVALGRERVRP